MHLSMLACMYVYRVSYKGIVIKQLESLPTRQPAIAELAIASSGSLVTQADDSSSDVIR